MISADRPDAAGLVQTSYEISFPVLSDPDVAAHLAFDVVREADEQTVERCTHCGIDLERWSNRKHHKIAKSSAFIVDKTGRVLWAHVSGDYKTRPSIAQLLGAIDHLGLAKHDPEEVPSYRQSEMAFGGSPHRCPAATLPLIESVAKSNGRRAPHAWALLPAATRRTLEGRGSAVLALERENV